MKDIVITAKQRKREWLIILACFIAACLVNLGAIIGYSRPWTELFSQIGYVVAVTVLLYILLWIVRGIVALVKCLIRKITKN